MTPPLGPMVSAPRSAVATALENELRALNEKITNLVSKPRRKPAYPAGIRSEIKKLRSLGYDLVVFEPETHLQAKSASKPRPPVSPAGQEKTVGKPGSAPFDPVLEGRKVLARMREAEGGSLTGAQLLQQHGLTPSTLHRRRKEHRIVFWRDAKHDFHYPVWQFTASGSLLPGVQEVLQIFKSTDESRILRYFLAKRDQLEGITPLEYLRAGGKSKIIDHAARHYAENTW